MTRANKTARRPLESPLSGLKIEPLAKTQGGALGSGWSAPFGAVGVPERGGVVVLVQLARSSSRRSRTLIENGDTR